MKNLSKMQEFETVKYASLLFIGNMAVYKSVELGMVDNYLLPISYSIATAIFLIGAVVKLVLVRYNLTK